MIHQKKMLYLKNAPFRSCITKSNYILEYVLEYSGNYSMTSVNLWNYYRYEVDDENDDNSEGKSFK